MYSSTLVELHKIGWPLLFCLTVLCHVVLPSSSLITEKKQTTVRICRTSWVPHPKLDAKWMMHHHNDLSMLMVAPHGCVDW